MKNRQSFTLIVFLFAIIAFLPNAVSAKEEWLKVRSKNFVLVGNASEKDIRKVATKLEQFRETFRLLFTQTNLNSSIPTNVVVFKSDSAYKPFKPKRTDGKTDNFVAGYFQPGEDVNYITISTEGEDADTYGTIFHEFVHSIINTNFGKSEVPPWFNEGLAEYYQTFAIEEDQKVKLGLAQGEHLLLLQQTKLIPLETLFKISNYALHQTGNHSRSIFYAESWALIHYLIQSGKTAGLSKFLTLSLKDVPSEKAFHDAFQSTYAQMESDLRKYVEKRTYQYSMITFKSKLTFESEMQTSLLSDAESNAYLGDLLYHTNRAEDAEPFLEKAVAAAPASSMANTTFGMVKLRQRKFDEAKKYLEKAISDDQTNHLAFYNYAFLISREDRDEFGYVQSFPADKTAKMRELLKRAIAINPGFTESYELLAFVNLVNNEQLDEAVSYLRTALKYQPGSQQYAVRIAEIYLRQEKFSEAAAIADKIAKTADEPEIKSLAENLISQLKQRQEITAQNEAARKQYEAAIAEVRKNGGQSVVIRRAANGKTLSPEEAAKIEAERKMRSLNQAIKKAETGEKQIIGRIQKIDCKPKTILYTIKTADETFTLVSKDFEGLTLTALVADAQDSQIGCGANVASINAVLTFKSQTDAKDMKNINRGELTAVDFVPNDFRFVEAGENSNAAPPEAVYAEEENAAVAPPNKSEDLNRMRRAAMMQAIKTAMRQPQAGEKRGLGFVEKAECSGKNMFVYFKTPTRILKLSVASPQNLQLRAFTSDVGQVQFGCNQKQIDIPVVFTYKENADPKSKSGGELAAMEFVPKTFVLDE